MRRKGLNIRTFGEVLSAVCDLQEFAASENVPELVVLFQDAKDIIQSSLVKKSQHCTLKKCGDRETRSYTTGTICKLFNTVRTIM
jgi:hypothetical protein